MGKEPDRPSLCRRQSEFVFHFCVFGLSFFKDTTKLIQRWRSPLLSHYCPASNDNNIVGDSDIISETPYTIIFQSFLLIDFHKQCYNQCKVDVYFVIY
jgi:hypothetical protein